MGKHRSDSRSDREDQRVPRHGERDFRQDKESAGDKLKRLERERRDRGGSAARGAVWVALIVIAVLLLGITFGWW